MTQATSDTSSPSSQEDVPAPSGKPLTIYEEIAQRSDKLSLLLKGTGTSPERLIHAFQMEMYQNPKLQHCQKASLLQSLMRCAEMGLEPGAGSVYLIPYNGIVQTQVGVQDAPVAQWEGREHYLQPPP